MWRPSFTRERRVLRVCRDRVELWRDGRDTLILLQSRSLKAERHPDPALLSAAIGELLLAAKDEATGTPVLDVVVESAWMPIVPLPTQDGMLSRGEIDALLRHRLRQAYADERTRTDEWTTRLLHRPGDPLALGCALDPAVLTAIRQSTASAGLVPRSIQPAIGWGWSRMRRARRQALRKSASREAWWLWQESDRALVSLVGNGCIHELNPAVALPCDEQWAAVIEREALRSSARATEADAVISDWTSDGVGRPGYSPPVDFVRHGREPAIGWLLLGLGLVALGVAAWSYQQREARRAQDDIRAMEQEAAERRVRDLALRPKPVSADELRWRHVAAQLEQPWLPTLRAIEAVTESPVYLIGLNIDPASGKAQLDVEAPSFDLALAYLQRLAEDGALVAPQLVSHESTVDPFGRASVRFTVLAQWRQP